MSSGICKPKEKGVYHAWNTYIKLHPNQKWEFSFNEADDEYTVCLKEIVTIIMGVDTFEECFNIKDEDKI